MAYRHHPQRGHAAPDTGSGGISSRAVFALAVTVAVAGGAWLLFRDNAPPPPITTAQIDAGSPISAPETSPPVLASGSERRQSEPVRGTLIMPNLANRRLTASEIEAMSREQLQLARAQIHRKQGIAGPGLSAVEAANLRLIDAAEKAR